MDRAGARYQWQRQERRLCGRRAKGDHSAQRRKSGHVVRCEHGSRLHQGHARLNAAFYGLAIANDGMVWGSVLGFPGGIVRLNPGPNPPETALAEYYEVPWNDSRAPVSGFSPSGMDVYGNGVAWVGSGQRKHCLASFDRSKCKGPLNGPKATERQQCCPEGWTLYPDAGAEVQEREGFRQRRLPLLRLGGSLLIRWDWARIRRSSRATSSDSLVALVNGKFVIMRVPYPMEAVFAKGMDGRILDDPKAGWKGKWECGRPGARARRSTARPARGSHPQSGSFSDSSRSTCIDAVARAWSPINAYQQPAPLGSSCGDLCDEG